MVIGIHHLVQRTTGTEWLELHSLAVRVSRPDLHVRTLTQYYVHLEPRADVSGNRSNRIAGGPRKVSFDCLLERRPIDIRLLAVEASCPADLVHDVQRITGPKLLLHIVVNIVDETLRDAGVKTHPFLVGHPAENIEELVFAYRTDLDLRLDSPDEGGVDKFRRAKFEAKMTSISKGTSSFLPHDIDRKSIRGPEEQSSDSGSPPAVYAAVRNHR